MMRLLKKALISTVFFILICFLLIGFLLGTKPGLQTSFKLAQLFIPGSIETTQVQGRLLDHFTIETLNYHHNDLNLVFHQLSVDWQLWGLIHRQLDIKSIQARSLELQSDKNVQILKQIQLSGLINQELANLKSAQFYFLDQKINSSFTRQMAFPNTLKGSISFNQNQKQSLNRINGTIGIGGDNNQLHWAGDLHGLVELSLEGSLKQLSQLNQVIKWRNVHWDIDKNQTIKSPEGRVTLSGNYPALTLEVITKLSTAPQDEWQIKASVNGVAPSQWNIDAHMSHQLPSAKSEGLSINLAAKGSLADLNHGKLIFTIQPGQYQLPKDSVINTLSFIGGTIELVLNPNQLSAKGQIALDDHKKFNLALSLPKFNLAKGLVPAQPLNGDLSLVFNSLDFLEQLTPEIDHAKGQLTASIKAKGTVGNIKLDSALKLKNASMNLPLLGINLDAIDLVVTGKQKYWEAKGFVSSANKKLNIKGRGPLNKTFAADVNIVGTDFPLVKTQEYQINVSPKLDLKMTENSLDVQGLILVPFAHIKPQTFSNSLSLPDDVVYKSNEVVAPSVWDTRMNVKVKMGEEVELDFKGLHATLNGSVRILQLPQGPVNGSGELKVKEGEYKAYGQDLDIESGQLMFTGGSLDNPGISLKASKIINNTAANTGSNQLFDFNTTNLQSVNLGDKIKVGVEVSGRLSGPKIILFSNPAILSQADILSMLILGRPASQATKAGGQLLLAAISSMNLGSGTDGVQLLDQMKKNLGVDFNVQSNSNYNQATKQVTDSTSVVVGKSLSKRLYLSYNVGLSQSDPNVLTLKYLLNKFLSIQVSNSKSGNGVDLLYSRTKDKLNE